MRAYLVNRLTIVWACLTAVTITSWLIGRGHGIDYRVNAAVTVSVLAMAAVKALLVFRSFMEVQVGPVWLKRTAYGWVAGLLCVPLIAYWAGPKG